MPKLGKLPPTPRKQALHLGPFLTQAASTTTPTARDWLSRVTSWPMYGNDVYGCCVWASVGHAIQAWTAYAGDPLTVPLPTLLQAYHDVTGFDPDIPDTDQGTVLQDALDYWRTHGVGGHRILAFARVNQHDAHEVRAALNVFGALMVGMEFPAIAMKQFDARRPWKLVGYDGGIEGGHAVHLGAYSSTEFRVTTWGRVQRMTGSFAATYVDEVWAVVTSEWLTAAGTTPEGLDLQGLGAAFSVLTGNPNPFV